MTSSSASDNDKLLLQLAASHQGIQPLLRTFFSFLHRCTDFYVVDQSETKSMGFDYGVAENLVLEAYRSFPLHTPTGQEIPHPPPEKVIEKMSQRSKGKSSSERTTTASVRSQPKLHKNQETDESPQYSTTTDSVKCTSENKQIPVGNGGVGPTYTWTQTLHEATIYVTFDHTTRAKDVDVEIGSSHLKVGKKGEKKKIDGTLGGRVNKNNSMWTIENGSLVIELDKSVHTWWRNAIQGDPEIDATLVDSSRSITEYDSETQAAISRIMARQ